LTPVAGHLALVPGVSLFVGALALLDQFLDPVQARVAAVATQ